MILVNRIKQKAINEFIDSIECSDDNTNILIWCFLRFHAEIKNGVQLTVREIQAVVLVNEGQFADIFQPGRYELTTPISPSLQC